MKKIFLILFTCLFAVLLTACGEEEGNNRGESDNPIGTKTITCSKEYTEDGSPIKENIAIKYTSTKVKSIDSTVSMDTDPNYIDLIISSSASTVEEMNKLSGLTYEISKEGTKTVKYVVKVDYDKVNINEMKQYFGQYWEDDTIFTEYDEDMSVDTLKSEMIEEGYTCN